MDNLTHSLAGALLGQTGLKRLSGRAMPTLIIAANLPDIDAVATVLGTPSLAIRRGITHGPIALVLLPLLLTGLIIAWDRWRPRPDAPPVRPAALLLLAFIGTLSHPALDWLNSYGVRLLEPFSQRWYAGDTLFIIDLWLWIALIAGVWLSLRRERANRPRAARPAIAALATICAYIFANGLITGHAERATSRELAQGETNPTLVVANPVPLEFWRRNMLWRDAARYGSGRFALGQGVSDLGTAAPLRLDDPRLAALATRRDVAAFLFWSRMPIVVTDDAGRTMLTDQRFASGIARGSFAIRLDR
ncbi:MAG: metal-dependent hydrolase [Pseudomonadota bacterium]|nr:metal-dependent hydrolase [Pseudomonadota bacterium]